MSTPELLKIPLLLLLSSTVLVISKSPSPPADEQARRRFDDAHSAAGVQAQRASTKWMPRIFRTFIWAIYALEILAILLQTYGHASIYLRQLPVVNTLPTSAQIRITPQFMLGAMFIIAGTLVRRAANRTLGKYFTFELAIQRDHKLVTSGPYAYVRHPGYTGNYLYMPGLVLTQLCAGSWWAETGMWGSTAGKVVGRIWLAFVGLTLASMVHRTMQEDKVLKGEFKDEWLRYAKRTPYRLIPFIF